MTSYSDKLQHPKWQKKKYEIYERDRYRCCKCTNPDRPLRVHHIYYEYGKEPWDYSNEYLKTLCEKHHKSEHDCKKQFNNILVETLKRNFYYSDILDVSCIILRMFKDRQTYEYFRARLDSLVVEIEQAL
jgi:5-methylcytosine-specific restriction endonuclease McrA